MLITVQCPGCAKQFHLNADMRGKRIRCNNAVCQEIFEVQDGSKEFAKPQAASSQPAAAPSAAPATPPAKQGHISDMIPLVSAEAVDGPKPSASPTTGSATSASVGQMIPLVSAEAVAAPEEAPTWKQAPPPVRRAGPATKPQAAPLEEKPTWQATPPPVRRSAPASAPPAPPPTPAPTPAPESAKPQAVPAESPKQPAPPAASWQAAPPPVRRAAAETAKLQPLPAEPAKQPSPPVESAKPTAPVEAPKPTAPPVTPQLSLESKTEAPTDRTAKQPAPPQPKEAPSWEAAPPPVRRAEEPATPQAVPDWPAPLVESVSETPVVPTPAPPKRGYSTYVVVLMLLVCAGLIGWFYWHGLPDPEEAQRQHVKSIFDKAGNWKEYAEAAEGFGRLRKSFPESEYAKEYAFFEELSSLLRDVHGASFKPDDEMKKLRKFREKWEQDPQFQQNRPEIAKVIEKAIDEWLKAAEALAKKQPLSPTESDKLEEQIKTARDWGEEGNPFWIEGKLPESLRNRIEELQRILDQAREREKFIAKLKAVKKPKLKDIETLNWEARDAGLDKDAEVQKLFDELYRKAVPTVEYAANPEPARLSDPPTPLGLVIAPRVDGTITPLAKNPGIVFAMVRGILYALAENDGHVVWATRVGIDTQHLPVRLPPTETNEHELALVMSSDSNTLTARRVVDGQAIWRHQLPAPSLGRPLVVEREIRTKDGETFRSRRVYLATADGRVHEIEIADGHLLGEFNCGGEVRLLLGGAQQAGSPLLYFAADRDFVLVFDVDQKRMVGAVRTNHPSGSLRGEPILIGHPGKPDEPAHMVLAQTDGLEAMRLRVWRLPTSWDGQEAKEEPPPAAEAGDDRPWWVAGWQWFAPRCDGEKIVLATDAGRLGLFGINQSNNADSPIFPLLGKKRPTVALGHRDGRAGRSQIIHATETDFWILAQGEAQHWRLGFARRDGLTVGAEWPRALSLGSPLHAGQVSRSGDALFVVTQSLNRSVCLATTIDSETGDIRWQRQLGLVAAHDPVVVGSRVLALDQNGSLFQFDPALFPAQANQLPVQEKILASGASTSSLFRLDGDGSTYLIGSPAANTLTVRQYSPGKKADEAKVKEWAFPQALAGTPTMAGRTLILPHADGNLRRLPLVEGGLADRGLPWRADGADPDAPGYVVQIAGHDFLYTDGSRGLSRLSWEPGDPVGKKKELKLPPLEKIVAAPLVLSTEPLQVCVADASGTITLLGGPFLQKQHSWKLDGKVTAGPVLRGKQIVCIVDGKQVVALDPENKQQPAWTYADADGARIVGLPQQAGGRLLVAHLNGRLASIDLATGQRKGNGFAIQASAAPAAAPVAFGDDRIFAPLTDGSVLLLSFDQLEGK